MSSELAGKRIAFLVANVGVEQVELTSPWQAVKDAGGEPVAAICHGPWILVEAAVVAGKSLTSWPSLQTDISNAGGVWHDERVLLCSAMGFDLVTSRKPDDLDAFNQQLVTTFARAA
jgi:putative intracellular protease/amidase